MGVRVCVAVAFSKGKGVAGGVQRMIRMIYVPAQPRGALSFLPLAHPTPHSSHTLTTTKPSNPNHCNL